MDQPVTLVEIPILDLVLDLPGLISLAPELIPILSQGLGRKPGLGEGGTGGFQVLFEPGKSLGGFSVEGPIGLRKGSRLPGVFSLGSQGVQLSEQVGPLAISIGRDLASASLSPFDLVRQALQPIPLLRLLLGQCVYLAPRSSARSADC